MIEKTDCNDCSLHLVSKDDKVEFDNYLDNLSRGKLIKPSSNLSHVVSTAFAQLDIMQKVVPSESVRKLCNEGLEKYLPHSKISCDNHGAVSRRKVISTIVNIFFNNKQHRSADEVRQQQVVSFKRNQRNKVR